MRRVPSSPTTPRSFAISHAWEEAASAFPEKAAKLTATQIELLGETYNTPLSQHDAAEQPGHVLTKQPAGATGPGVFDPSGRGVLVVDDFLMPAALESLRTYLLRSTIWHDFAHIEGHVASYFEDGLACPLLLQIAAEIRASYSDVLGAHPLSQAWAFKGIDTGAAIGAHADDAAVSVNFWLTPDEANPGGGGGMTICLEAPPADWTMADYDSDRRRSDGFMTRHAANSVTVPYRQNRAVMFASKLIHKSDAPHFATGYENHRINITLLYGRTGPKPSNKLE